MMSLQRLMGCWPGKGIPYLDQSITCHSASGWVVETIVGSMPSMSGTSTVRLLGSLAASAACEPDARMVVGQPGALGIRVECLAQGPGEQT
jgi:hypothetical protein